MSPDLTADYLTRRLITGPFWVRRGIGQIVLLFMVLSTGFVQGRETWPTFHGDFSLKGYSSVSVGENPELEWRFNSGGQVDTTPVSDGERVFVSVGKGRIAALALSGELLWEKTFTRTNDAGQVMAFRFEAPLMCADGLVFAANTKGSLIALDAASGAEEWRYETDGVIIGSPNCISAQEVLILDQAEGALHCVDMETGKRVWKTDGVERCDGAPGVGAEYIAFGSCLAQLHVYKPDGTHAGNIDVGGDAQIAGGVAVDGHLAFAGVRDGGMICFDLKTMETVWSSDESEDQTFSTPAVTDGQVVYSSDNGFVYAVKKSDGSTVWAFDTGGLPTSPVVAGDQVVVTADGVLYVLGLKDGAGLWLKEISDEITSPALVDGRIMVGAEDGTISVWHSSVLSDDRGSSDDEL